MFAVVHKIKNQQEEYRTHLCTINADNKQGVWLSSESILNVMLFNYSPYSSMEVEFHVSSLNCVSVTISLCHETQISGVNLLNTGAIDISHVAVKVNRYLNKNKNSSTNY